MFPKTQENQLNCDFAVSFESEGLSELISETFTEIVTEIVTEIQKSFGGFSARSK